MNTQHRQKLAGKARDFLRQKNINLGQREAQELIARLDGFEDLHAAQQSEGNRTEDFKQVVTALQRLRHKVEAELEETAQNDGPNLTYLVNCDEMIEARRLTTRFLNAPVGPLQLGRSPSAFITNLPGPIALGTWDPQQEVLPLVTPEAIVVAEVRPMGEDFADRMNAPRAHRVGQIICEAYNQATQQTPAATSCKKCGSSLHKGFCVNGTCPYSDWPQFITPDDLFDRPLDPTLKRRGVNAHGNYEIPGTDEMLQSPDDNGRIRRLDKNLTVVEHRDVYDLGWDEWAEHFGKVASDYRLFRNHYKCPKCESVWSDEWDCTCNDRCPKCNAEIEPTLSEQLDPKTRKVLNPDAKSAPFRTS